MPLSIHVSRFGALLAVPLALTVGATASRAQQGPPPKVTAELLAKMQTQPCLHIGDVSVGPSRQTVEGTLGQPCGAPVRQEGDLTVQVYLLKAADPTQGKEPFYAITTRASSPARPSTAVARLGEPARRELVPANGADLWIYDPHLISLEMSNGVVSSIKIAFKRLP